MASERVCAADHLMNMGTAIALYHWGNQWLNLRSLYVKLVRSMARPCPTINEKITADDIAIFMVTDSIKPLSAFKFTLTILPSVRFTRAVLNSDVDISRTVRRRNDRHGKDPMGLDRDSLNFPIKLAGGY